MTDTYQTTSLLCPHCGHCVASHTGVVQGGIAPDRDPQDGDLSICTKCTGVGVFDVSAVGGIRKATPMEAGGVPERALGAVSMLRLICSSNIDEPDTIIEAILALVRHIGETKGMTPENGLIALMASTVVQSHTYRAPDVDERAFRSMMHEELDAVISWVDQHYAFVPIDNRMMQ